MMATRGADEEGRVAIVTSARHENDATCQPQLFWPRYADFPLQNNQRIAFDAGQNSPIGSPHQMKHAFRPRVEIPLGPQAGVEQARGPFALKCKQPAQTASAN